jgi:hypothetical protein
MALTKVTYAMIKGEVVNILDYNATGDGVTDDTTAYLAAIATGKNVYFPEGTYVVAPITGGSDRTSAAILSEGQCLMGDGANSIIKWKTGVPIQTAVMIKNASNITITDLKFIDCALALQITPDTDDSVKNVIIQNCYFEDLGIALGLGDQLATNNDSKSCANITVQNCVFNTIGVHAVLLSNVNGFIVDNCYFENVGYIPTSGGDCVDMSQGSRYGTVSNCIGTDSRYFCKVESNTPSGGVAAKCLSHNISILNNNIYAMTPQGALESEFAIAVINGVSDVIISNNTIEYPNTAIFCSDTNPAATGPLFITSNTIAGGDWGILTFMDNAGINIPLNITDNTINSTNTGIRVIHSSVSVKDNFIESDTCIEVRANSDGLSFVGNHLLGTGHGILFNASTTLTDNVQITGNKISSINNFIYLPGPHKQLSVVGNHFRGTDSGGYVNNVDSLMFSNNYIQDNSASGVPGMNITTVSNAVVNSNVCNTNTANASVSLSITGTLLNVLVINNVSSDGVTVGAGTNVTSTNNAFVIAYTA